MLKKTLNKIRGTPLGYNLGRKVLSTPLIVNSSIYDKLYQKKIKNTIKNREYPLGLDIGTTNLCNAACIMCPHTKLKKMGTMDMKLYKKIIDNCEKLKIMSLTLSFFGEPLLDKDLIQKIKYAKERKMKVAFFSNASLLTEKWAKELIESGLDGITISFDGYSKATYEKIRKSTIVIYLFDAHTVTSKELAAIITDLKRNLFNSQLVLVANKIDKEDLAYTQQEFSSFKDMLFISAKNKQNIEDLKKHLITMFDNRTLNVTETIITNARHVEALQNTNKSLIKVLEGLNKNITGDLMATDIRDALNHLGEITGEITSDDLLTNIFSRFCIGK